MLTVSHLMQAFEASGAADLGVVYVSVPITSGVRELELMAELGATVESLRGEHRQRWLDEVLKHNEVAAAEVTRSVRARASDRLVVDPSRMSVVGWEQDDYNGFWLELIEKYAVEVVASPGWEFSRGARGEVVAALRLGVAITTVDGDELSEEEVRGALSAARVAATDLGLDDAALASALPAADGAPPPSSAAAASTFDWLVRERAYQTRKFGTALDDEHTAAGFDDDSWWWQQLTNYYHRARVLGVETPIGRQAMAKFTATACGLLESVIRVHGEPPAPGVPSGEVS